MPNKVILPCQLCEFRGCDGDFCRHGSVETDSGYHRCLWEKVEFDPKLLSALAGHPLKGALLAAEVYEPRMSAVVSRLDIRFNVSYGKRGGSAHLQMDSLKQLEIDGDPTIGKEFSDDLFPEAPKTIIKVAKALSDIGYRITSHAEQASPGGRVAQFGSATLWYGKLILPHVISGIQVRLDYDTR